MPRPKCCRRIAGEPPCRIFKPAGVPRAAIGEIILSMDEFEAIRLADLQGLHHEQAAAQMNVSRPTFGRIIGEARGKLARVLVEGLALRIEGGAVELAGKWTFRCHRCQRKWTEPPGSERPGACPDCDCTVVSRTEGERSTGRTGESCPRELSHQTE